MRRVEIGFDEERAFSAQIALPKRIYPTVQHVARFQQEWLNAIKANPEITCNEKTNAITIAAIKGKLAILMLFAKHHIDILSPDASGKTALDYAEENKHESMISYLKNIKQNLRPLKTRPAFFTVSNVSLHNTDSPYKPRFQRAR